MADGATRLAQLMTGLTDTGSTNFASLLNELGGEGGGKLGEILGILSDAEFQALIRVLNNPNGTGAVTVLSNAIKHNSPQEFASILNNASAMNPGNQKKGCAGVLLLCLAVGSALPRVLDALW